MFVGELDGHVVDSRGGGQVGDGHGAVLVVVAVDVRLAGTLHGQGKAA